MSIHHFATKFILPSLIALGFMSTANAAVTCPSVSDVKASDRALNTVMQQGSMGFFVFTAQPAINSSGLGWLVLTQESANGFDEAHASGQRNVKGVVSAATDKPMEQQGAYLCPYLTTGDGMGVIAIAPQQNGFVFDPRAINLQNIK